jgi:hypothetical protein
MKRNLFITLAGMLAFNIAANAQSIFVADYSANVIEDITPGGGKAPLPPA